ncbi:MAG TPA: hypothetical protein VNW97_10110 [Candidatus Saccharimonadales bacterium]|nr:hypothetical protein [Candidatus Saccharimonadales bacterium]
MAAHEISGDQMVELDIFYFYRLSMSVSSLTRIYDEGDVPISVAGPHLRLAKMALESLSTKLMQRVFPDSTSKAHEIVNIINRILPRTPSSPTVYEPYIPAVEILRIRQAISTFTIALETESKHRYVICVEDQRCLSAYTLVEKIEMCFPPEAWNTIDQHAKREFEESGKALSLERYTAAGFHALRGVECVIRQYLIDLTGSQPAKRDWGHYIQMLKQAGVDANLIAVLDNIRTLNRNPLMHPEDWLDIDDAIGVFNISHTAIARLAEGIQKALKSKNPVP